MELLGTLIWVNRMNEQMNEQTNEQTNKRHSFSETACIRNSTFCFEMGQFQTPYFPCFVCKDSIFIKKGLKILHEMNLL